MISISKIYQNIISNKEILIQTAEIVLLIFIFRMLINIIKTLIYIFFKLLPQKMKKIFWQNNYKKGENFYREIIEKEKNEKELKKEYPFENKNILNKDEIKLYNEISNIISSQFIIAPKINFKNILKYIGNSYYENDTLNTIKDLTIDFLILDKNTFKPILLIIEKEKYRNYEQTELISQIINVDIAYISFNELYNTNELKNRINEKIGIN